MDTGDKLVRLRHLKAVNDAVVNVDNDMSALVNKVTAPLRVLESGTGSYYNANVGSKVSKLSADGYAFFVADMPSNGYVAFPTTATNYAFFIIADINGTVLLKDLRNMSSYLSATDSCVYNFSSVANASKIYFSVNTSALDITNPTNMPLNSSVSILADKSVKTGINHLYSEEHKDFVDNIIENTNDNLDELNKSVYAFRMNEIAKQNGYNKAIYFEWEDGSINTGNGTNVNSGTNVVRTKEPVSLTGNVVIVVTSSSFRIKPFVYNNDGTYNGSDNWHNTVSKDEYDISSTKKYRFQIATNDGTSVINKEEALKSVFICYADDVVEANVPSYWKTTIENKVNTINGLMTDGADKTAFMFVTDTHWNESDTLNNKGINTDLMRYIKQRCNISTLVHGGDLNSEYRSNKNIARQMMTKPMYLMRSVFDDVLVTRGNHDDNIEGAYNNWSYVITQSDSYSYMFRNTNGAVFGKTGTYFYKDNAFEKTRFICLDCVDMVYSNSVDSTKCDQKILAYGHDQLQWLCETLRDTPSGYSIIIYTHAMLAQSIVTKEHPADAVQTRANNYLIVCDILKAYKNRQDYSFDCTGYFTTVHQNYYDGEIGADFTSSNATIVGVFSGHEHVDCIEEIKDYQGNGIGIYNTCTQNSSAMFASSIISYPYQSQMTIGTTTELVWDVVIIDRKNKNVNMVRIGAGADSVRTFNY